MNKHKIIIVVPAEIKNDHFIPTIIEELKVNFEIVNFEELKEPFKPEPFILMAPDLDFDVYENYSRNQPNKYFDKPKNNYKK